MSTKQREPSTTDRFREIGPLGAGGMATVTLAEDTLLRRRVALKRLHTAAGGRELERLRREALVGASLNHRNLVSVYDVYVDDSGQLVIVMEYVPGESLYQAIRARGAIAPGRALEILRQLAAGLDAIHARGVVHRDVKPANVLLGSAGEVKLADLGIAAAPDRTQTTAGGDVAGTFSYMAPEQLEGQAPSAAIDIYALAAVAFEMLCGRKARREANPVALAHAISTRPPPDLTVEWPDAPVMAAAVLRQGMSVDPAERPASAGSLVARLAEALDPQTTEAHAAQPTGARVPVAPSSALPRGGAPVVRRIPRVQPALDAGDEPSRSRSTGARSRARAETAAPPPVDDHAGRRSRGLQPVPARPARGRPSRASRRARIGAVVALLLAIAVVPLAAGFSFGGASQKTTSTGEAGAPPTKPVRRSAAPAPKAPSSAGPTASTQSTGSARSTPSSAGSSAQREGSNGVTTARTSAVLAGNTPPASAPAAAVEAFYGHAARHEYSAAWALADANMRNQLAGFGSFRAQQSAVRSITFHRAQLQAGSGEVSSSATVALQTTAVLADRTEQCAGTARLVRSGTAGWLLDGISINCTP